MEFTLPLPSFNNHTSASCRNWQHIKQRFKDHLGPNEKKCSKNGAASLLMFLNGDKIRDVMQAFSSDASHKMETLDDAFENIEDLCLPSFILLYERFKFFSFRQKRFKDLRKFVLELQMLADYCELQDEQQKHVTDKIIDGVSSESLRKHLRSISDLELAQALEICEEAQEGRMKKCVDVTCKKISGKREVARRKPYTANRQKGIVNGKDTVSGKKRSVSGKKGTVSGKKSTVSGKKGTVSGKKGTVSGKKGTVSRKKDTVSWKKGIVSGKQGTVSGKEGSQKSVLNDDVLQQTHTTKSRSRSARNKLINVASVSKTDHCTEAVSMEISPASFPTSSLRKFRKTSLTKHTRSLKTLIKRCIITSDAESLVSESGHEFQVSNTHTTTSEVDIPDKSSFVPNKSAMSESNEATKEKNVGLDSASCDTIINEIYPVSKIGGQFEGRQEVNVKLPQMDDFTDLKSDQEICNLNQQNINDNSENKNTRKFRKCTICSQAFSTSCECHSSGHLDRRVDKCSICDIDFTDSGSLSQHMKQTHPDLLTFHCDVCDVLFECQKSLAQHRSSHSKGQKIMCTDCGVSFKSTREYHRHRRKEHKNVSYGCDKCGLSFPYPSKLKLHLMGKHNATKPFMCEICGSSFAEKNMLTTHKNIHSGEKKHECPTCGRWFLLKTTLSNHIQTHLDRRPHTCEVCGMGFKLSYYLKSHMKTHSENRERPHICSKCGAAFLKLAQLKNHERKHTGEKPYSCHVCNTHFSQLSSMKKHIKRIHEGVMPKDRFSCEYCGLSFTHSCKLKLHLMKHTGERPFACTFCGSTYREKHQLNTHMKIHSGSEPFKCPFCTRRFLQKSSLEGHVRKHTGEKPFQCPICFQHFSHKGYLRDHIKVHDENRERKYKCSICEKAFTCSSHMRSHERLHSGDKPHKCDVCGARFTKRSSVKKHLKRTHGIQDVKTLQVQNSNIVSNVSEAVAVSAGLALSHMQPVDVADQAEQHQTDIQHGIQHQVQMEAQIPTETQTELQTDRSTELRPVETAGITLQMHSELHLSHIHSVITHDVHSELHPQLQHSMCAGLHTVHPALHHQIHQHPGIQILHPGLHAAVHLHRDSQIIPCVTSNVNTTMQQPENIQEMHVYTLAT